MATAYGSQISVLKASIEYIHEHVNGGNNSTNDDDEDDHARKNHHSSSNNSSDRFIYPAMTDNLTGNGIAEIDSRVEPDGIPRDIEVL